MYFSSAQLYAGFSTKRAANAAYFHLYGIDRDDAEYVLSTLNGIHERSPPFAEGRSTAERVLELYMSLPNPHPLDNSRHLPKGEVAAQTDPELYALSMQTTLEINDALLADAEKLARDTGRTLSQVVEDALRKAVTAKERNSGRIIYVLHTFGGKGLQPGVDLNSNLAVADSMEM